jgi:hypothetical protein
MQFREMKYSAALAIVLAVGSTSMALAQSADVSASANASVILAAQQQTYLDVMANLEAAGYTVVETKTTFLGRVQITARNAAHLREVVVSRSTGEVKSDVILETFVTGDAAAVAEAAPEAAAPEETKTGGILGLLGFGGTSAGATADVTGSASAGTSSVGGSLSGSVSSGISGVTGGLSGVTGGLNGGANGSAGGSSGTSGGSASGGVSGGLGL